MFGKWKNRARSAEPPLTVLALMTSPGDRDLLRQICAGATWKILFADDVEEAVGRPAGIVLCDRDLSGIDWREAIRRLATSPHPRKVILASYVVDDYLWDEVIHCGGYDVLPKPFRVQEVIHTIQFARAAVTKSLPSAPHTE
jgi:CheY-like chemotaxis protein